MENEAGGQLCFKPSMSYKFDCDELKQITAKKTKQIVCSFGAGIIYHLLTRRTA